MTYELRRNRPQLSALQAQEPKSRGARVVAASLAALGVLAVVWAMRPERSDEPAAQAARAQSGAVSHDGRAWSDATFSPFAAVPGPSTAEESMANFRADPRAAPRDLADAAAVAPESALSEALASPQEDVRRDGLQWALGAGVEVSQDTLQELLANDASDEVRKLALQGLTERPEATREEIRSILDAAATNPSAAVRADAAHMIARMDELAQMDEQARAFRRRGR